MSLYLELPNEAGPRAASDRSVASRRGDPVPHPAGEDLFARRFLVGLFPLVILFRF